MPWKFFQRRKEIMEIFSEKPTPYKAPLPRKAPRLQARGRSGKPRILSEEERMLYQLRTGPKLSTE